MKQSRAICNVTNANLRHFLTLLVSPIVLIVYIVMVICRLFVSTKRAAIFFYKELAYNFSQDFNVVHAGMTLAWIGRKAYDEKAAVARKAKIERMFNRANNRTRDNQDL